jgi:hypothetical protein
MAANSFWASPELQGADFGFCGLSASESIYPTAR